MSQEIVLLLSVLAVIAVAIWAERREQRRSHQEAVDVVRAWAHRRHVRNEIADRRANYWRRS